MYLLRSKLTQRLGDFNRFFFGQHGLQAISDLTHLPGQCVAFDQPLQLQLPEDKVTQVQPAQFPAAASSQAADRAPSEPSQSSTTDSWGAFPQNDANASSLSGTQEDVSEKDTSLNAPNSAQAGPRPKSSSSIGRVNAAVGRSLTKIRRAASKIPSPPTQRVDNISRSPASSTDERPSSKIEADTASPGSGSSKPLAKLSQSSSSNNPVRLLRPRRIARLPRTRSLCWRADAPTLLPVWRQG